MSKDMKGLEARKRLLKKLTEQKKSNVSTMQNEEAQVRQNIALLNKQLDDTKEKINSLKLAQEARKQELHKNIAALQNKITQKEAEARTLKFQTQDKLNNLKQLWSKPIVDQATSLQNTSFFDQEQQNELITYLKSQINNLDTNTEDSTASSLESISHTTGQLESIESTLSQKEKDLQTLHTNQEVVLEQISALINFSTPSEAIAKTKSSKKRNKSKNKNTKSEASIDQDHQDNDNFNDTSITIYSSAEQATLQTNNTIVGTAVKSTTSTKDTSTTLDLSLGYSNNNVNDTNGWQVNLTKQNNVWSRKTSNVIPLTSDQNEIWHNSLKLCAKHCAGDRTNWTTPTPEYINQNHPKYADAIARLLTSYTNQKCTAISVVDTTDHHPVVLVANSAVNDPSGIDKSIKALKEFFNDHSPLGYKNLITYAIQMVDDKLQNDTELKQRLDNIFTTNRPSTCEEWINFIQNSSDYLNNHVKHELLDAVLSPITDCIIIRKEFDAIDDKLKQAIMHYNGDLTNSTVKYLSNYTSTMHPDIKILSEIITLLQHNMVEKQNEFVVGLSKLCCFGCDISYKATEQHSEEICNVQTLKFNTPGTSGNVIPAFITHADVAPYLKFVYKELVSHFNTVPSYPAKQSNTDTTIDFDMSGYLDSINATLDNNIPLSNNICVGECYLTDNAL